MERVPNGKYSKEFREEAAKLVVEGGSSVPEVCRKLSIPHSTLEYWIKAYKKGKLGDIGKNQKPLTELELELAKVKKSWPRLRWSVIY